MDCYLFARRFLPKLPATHFILIGKFMNPERTFAIEFSVDHRKYNTDFNQTVQMTGTAPQTGNVTLTPQNFSYALHNGLNHLMVTAWARNFATTCRQHNLRPGKSGGTQEHQCLLRLG